MNHDREGPLIVIWHSWLPSSFENVLSFHAKYYVDISGSRKRHVSEFFTRNLDSKGPSSICSTALHPEHESLKICHITPTSWKSSNIVTQRICEFLGQDESWFFSEYSHYGVWATSRDEVPETLMAKMTLKSGSFRSFGPFLESKVILH
jgi:hypothetical protein